MEQDCLKGLLIRQLSCDGINKVGNKTKVNYMSRVQSNGGVWGGKFLPQALKLPPQKVSQMQFKIMA